MPRRPLGTNDREMKRLVTASGSKAVTAEGISNTNMMKMGFCLNSMKWIMTKTIP